MRTAKKISMTAIALIAAISIFGTSVFAEGDTIKRGSKGSEVEQLQQLLMEQGFFNYDAITGYFGIITEDAVKAFQTSKGLKADGIVGEQTRAALYAGSDYAQTVDTQADDINTEVAEEDTVETTAATVTISKTISNGMEGEEVILIQQRLQELGLYNYSRITGYFGLITKAAVMDFQKAYGLKEDGVVGRETMEKLFSEYKETSLIPGMRNDDVGQVQTRLKELGYYSYSIDNEYGAKTREAVIYFQRAHDLKADGIVGTQTKQILYSSGAITEQEARRKLATDYDNTVEEPTDTVVILDENATVAQQIIDFTKTKLGCPYVYAADGPNAFDCSGFTKYIFGQFGISLPRTAYSQGYDQYGVKITDPSTLQPGDLVFFNTNNTDGDLSDHAGIYIGNGDFIHANSGSAMSIVISNMYTSEFYKSAFSWGRRVLG